ncbi:MAG: hypothetical protein ABII18_13685 [bacterium]|nr:hypothetical protein [bacterium]MBU1918703.1 hypothetical protein [bacterium]
MNKISIIIVLSTIFLTSCFGGLQKEGSVLGYSKGVVRTQGGSFYVGKLPTYWKQEKIAYRAVLFANQHDFSTITIDSWCRDAAGDASLRNLTEDLFRGINNFQDKARYDFTAAGRAALLTEGYGSVDGRDIFISAYVFKMNTCVFDFLYVTLPDQMGYYDDFKNMIKEFRFIKGPKIL